MRRTFLVTLSLFAAFLLCSTQIEGRTHSNIVESHSQQGELSNTCEFRSGPRKGQRQRYADQDPLPVGTPCRDGRGSRGMVVSERGP
jgi:hypothetical protein